MKTSLRSMVCVAAVLLFGSKAFGQRTFTSQYTFGDSLSDSGNLYALTNRTQPPSPPYAQRFSNGPTFAELLGNQILPAVTVSARRGNLNFAFGGATAALGSQVPSLQQQLGMFAQQGLPAGPNDLFTVLAGANDLIPVLSSPSTPLNPNLLDAAGVNTANAVATAVAGLTTAGAKNIVVLGMPNLGATPRALAGGGVGGAGSTFGLRASTAFNTQLISRLQTAATATPDVNFVYVDLQNVLDRIVRDFRALGYANASSYYLAPAAAGGGVGDPNSYVFFDDIHPTARTHALLAAIVLEELNPESVIGFNAAVGGAALTLEGLATSALSDRTALLGVSNRQVGRADAYVAFNYGDGERDQEGFRRAFDYRAQVVTAGVDLRLSDGAFVGGAVNMGRLNADAAGGNFTIEDMSGRLYAVWRAGPVALTIDADYGVLNVKGVHRTTAFGGFETSGKTAGDHWGVGLKAAWAIDLANGFVARPWLGLRTQRVQLDPWMERDVPSLSMDFAAQEAKSSAGAAGIDLGAETKLFGRAARFDLRAAWHGEMSNRNRGVSGRLAGNVTRLTTINVEDGDGSGVAVGAAATFFFSKNWSGTLGYTGDIRTDEKLGSRATFSLQTGF